MTTDRHEDLPSARARDHAIDLLLTEELGGIRPPDLEVRILAACTRRAVALPPAPPEPAGPRLVLLTSVCLGAVAAALALRAWSPEPEAPRLRAIVRDGTLVWRGPEQVQMAHAGDVLVVRPRRGDRVHAAPRAETTFAIPRLGALRCAPGTVLEVGEMQWKEFGGGLTIGALTVTVVFGAASWSGDGADARAGAGARIELRDGRAAAISSGGAGLRAELQAAQAKIVQLQEQLDRRAAPPAPEPAAEPATKVEEAYAPLLADTAYDTALQGVDWREVGEAVAEYTDVHRRIESLRALGQEVPSELLLAEEQWEGQMLSEIGKVLRAGVPGSSITAQLHHPGVAANMMAAGLRKAGAPLTAAQLEEVQAVARKYALEDRVQRARQGDDDLLLANIVAENELGGRFFAELRGAVGPAQERILGFGELAGRTRSDPLSSGYQWARVQRAVQVGGHVEFAEVFGRDLARGIGLTPEQVERLRPTVTRWAEGLPPAWMEQKMNNLERGGSLEIARVRAAARAQLDLMRRIGEQLSLTPDQARKLRQLRHVYVPYGR